MTPEERAQRKREAQSCYRRSAKGRATQAAYRARTGRPDNARRVTTPSGDRLYLPNMETVEFARNMIEEYRDKQRAEQKQWNERLEGRKGPFEAFLTVR